jgi:hypothetical protein
MMGVMHAMHITFISYIYGIMKNTNSTDDGYVKSYGSVDGYAKPKHMWALPILQFVDKIRVRNKENNFQVAISHALDPNDIKDLGKTEMQEQCQTLNQAFKNPKFAK